MNPFTSMDPLSVHLALFFTGAFLGSIISAFLTGAKKVSDPFNLQYGEMDTPIERRKLERSPDTVLLDYLEGSEFSLFFNETAGDAGMWGILDGNNKMIAASVTLRGAIERFRQKEIDAALNDVQGEPNDGVFTAGAPGHDEVARG